MLNSNIIRNPDKNNNDQVAFLHSWWDNLDENTKAPPIHTAQGLYAQEVGEEQNPSVDVPNESVQLP